MIRPFTLYAGVTFFAAVLLSGCGGSSSPSSPSPTGTAAAAVSIPVGAQNLGTSGYAPNPLTIASGTTVTWTNTDTTAHTSTSDSPGVFSSGTIAAGGKFSFTFQNKGTFAYHCTFHSGMVGTVVVQ
jgi:plastocyanin